MYKIVGADQQEYGPVTADELRVWISEGRADAQTRTRIEGGAEWKPLGEFPEFARDLPPPLPPPPPAFGSAAPAGPPARAVSPLAIVGLVFAVLGLFCCGVGPVFATVGLICSCIALSREQAYPTRSGRGCAIAGIILSIVGLLLAIGLLSSGGLGSRLRRSHFRI